MSVVTCASLGIPMLQMSIKINPFQEFPKNFKTFILSCEAIYCKEDLLDLLNPLLELSALCKLSKVSRDVNQRFLLVRISYCASPRPKVTIKERPVLEPFSDVTKGICCQC